MAALPELSEDEHQALDLLEAVDAGEKVEAGELAAARERARAALERFVPAVAAMILRAVPAVLEAQRAHLEHADRVLMAIERVASRGLASDDAELVWLNAIRDVPLLAILQDDADASALAGPALLEHLERRREDLHSASRAALDRIERDPAAAWAFSPAIAATTQLLAVPRDSSLERMLHEGSGDADDQHALGPLARVVTRWKRAAYLKTIEHVAPEAAPARPAAPELVRFRLESMRDANNEVRAHALAGDVPDRIDLARVVAKQSLDPAKAIRAFGAAVDAALAAERQLEQPPGRRFTRLHMTLLVILLALTAWHYWLR